MRFPNGKPKAATFSFDDGFWFDVPVANILDRYGMKATFNITGSYSYEKRVGEPDLSFVKGKAYNELPITKDEIEEHILARGHEIAVHGYSHKAPGNTRAIEGITDILNCRLKLERDFGKIIRGLAYPDSGITRFTNGCSYDTVKNYLIDLDIAYSRTLEGDNKNFDIPTDWHAWMPTVYLMNKGLFDYVDAFTEINVNDSYAALRHPRLFYLWGHSFEFYTKLGWETLEKICKKLSSQNDIWYATNIEIYDYVNAYRMLRFSADGEMVYNPTLIEVWFDIDGKIYNIKSGETIVID